jgi:SET domain-containing protein
MLGSVCFWQILYKQTFSKCMDINFFVNIFVVKKEYANLELFFTGPKGWGLRAQSEIKKYDFSIISFMFFLYSGEILSSNTSVRS